MHSNDDNPESGWEEGPSKSAVKRQMHALQALGESLTKLSEKQLAQIPISDDELLAAIREIRNIRSNSARKRHLQYIGKLMRDIDPAPIEAALEALFRPAREQNEAFHELEQLRDELLSGKAEAIEAVLARWPVADRQQLRQLVLQHQRERQKGQAPSASRKLFRYLRDLQES